MKFSSPSPARSSKTRYVREVLLRKQTGEPIGFALARKKSGPVYVVAVKRRTCAWRANIFCSDKIVDAWVIAEDKNEQRVSLQSLMNVLHSMQLASCVLLRVECKRHAL